MAERRAIGWLAKNGLARYRPIFMVAQISLFIIGCMFWIDTQSGGQAFTAEVWGDLAYSIPASFWAFANMSTSALTAGGLMKPVKNWMVTTGAALSCLQYLTLSWSAVFDGGAAVIGLYASIFFLPLHIWIMVEAIGYDA